MSFVGELKRRNVIRVAILYFVSSWLLLQLTDVLSSILPVPEWTGSFVFMMLLIGLAPALIFSWVYEMTPEGLRRESDVDKSTSITPNTGKKINTVIAVLLVLAIAGMVADRLIPERGVGIESAEQVAAAPEIAGKASIAVLPFADLSEEGDQQFFTDGLSEELLNLLVRIDGLKVASRTSSFAYRGSSLGIPEIASGLGVAHVLEGSVRKSGDRIRITAQLIEADTDRHLWSDNFDRELDDIFAIQDEIGNAIVNALKDELGILEEVTVSVEAVTSNVTAYELYLEARELFIRREYLTESIRLFREAISLDAEFARAWEGLAAVEAVADDWIFSDDIYHAPHAIEAANRALELDPDLSMPFSVLGSVSTMFENNYVDGVRNMQIAVEKDPRNTTGLLWLGMSYYELGFFEEALSMFERCLAVDPGYQNCTHHMALTYVYLGQEEKAIQTFEPTLEENFHSSSDTFVPLYIRRGQSSLALVIADLKFQVDSAPVIEWIRAIEDPGPHRSAGLSRLQDWENRHASSFRIRDIPIVYLPFGAFKEFAASDYEALRMIWHPQARNFRKSEYFKPLIRRMGILAYWRENRFPRFCHPVGADDFACDDPF